MALTTFEKNIARRMLTYYSGKIPVGGEYDDEKMQEFMEGDEATRRTMVQEFVSTVLLPHETLTMENTQQQYNDSRQRAVVLSTYIGS